MNCETVWENENCIHERKYQAHKNARIETQSKGNKQIMTNYRKKD
jgi:hypothetical protein